MGTALPTRPAARLAAGSLIAAALCGCVKNVDDPPPPVTVDGSWTYHETLVDQVHGETCVDTGTYVLSQSGGKFSGTYQQVGECHLGSANLDNTGKGVVTKGQVSDIRVQFTADSVCSYVGQFSRTRASVDAGVGACAYDDPGTHAHHSYDISWDMEKQ